MQILWDKVRTPEILPTARYLSSEYMVRGALHNLHGDQESKIDVYLHAFSHYYNKLKNFIISNGLVEYTEGVDEIPAVLLHFATENFQNPVETPEETEEEYQEKHFLRTSKVFERFVALIATFCYHKYRYNGSPDDRKVEERNCYHTWLMIKKYNRENGILFDFTDEEFQLTIIEWYEQSILPKVPNLFEKTDKRHGFGCNDVVHTYEGPSPKIPKSEMVKGYGFDICI